MWGGIHPPVDDIPGRLIGKKVGINAFEYAENLFLGNVTGLPIPESNQPDISIKIYPNPLDKNNKLIIRSDRDPIVHIRFFNPQGISLSGKLMNKSANILEVDTREIPRGIYLVTIQTTRQIETRKLLIR
jgi:hypothetical protein